MSLKESSLGLQILALVSLGPLYPKGLLVETLKATYPQDAFLFVHKRFGK